MQGYTSNPPWTMRDLNYPAAVVEGHAADLELFLFGGARVDLSAARHALQVARWAYGQAEATSAQLWVSLKYTVNADRRCLEILGGRRERPAVA